MRKTVTRLADGRELVYYDTAPVPGRGSRDERPLLAAEAPASLLRVDRWRGETVGYAAHRQGRTHLPPADQCPLCPSDGRRQTEIPDQDYEVAVFENRFPSFGGGRGRCEVVCFTADHHASFGALPPERVRLVLEAWADRTAELSRRPGVRQVYCFENRGAEIGVTLAHPHGQVYGYPDLTPHTSRMLDALAEHGPDDLLAGELADPDRTVAESDHWIAYVPYAARWPFQVRLHPRRRVPELPALDEPARADFAGIYLRLLRGFDQLFARPDAPAPGPTPYISGWHQAPFGVDRREDFPLHLELFTTRRAADKLKHLAGSESGMGAFVNDVLPEAAAERLRAAIGEAAAGAGAPAETSEGTDR